MITIVTDSSAYFKKEEADELGVKIVPLNYAVNGKSFVESYGDQNGEFEELLKNGIMLSTSQPNVMAFLSCFENEIKKGNEILCITISSRLSGTFFTAQMAAKQNKTQKIAVFDSYFTTGGLYLLIKEARRLIDSGASLDEVVDELPKIRSKIQFAFTVDDIAPLRKSGRIGNVRMSVGTILNQKPILLLNEGIVVFSSIAHGNRDIIKEALKMTSEGAKEFIVNYIGYEQLTTNLYNVLTDAYPDIPVNIRKVGPVMGINLGLNAASLSFITS